MSLQSLGGISSELKAKYAAAKTKLEKDIVLVEGSITKWQNVVAGKEAGHYWKNCPCCCIYLDNEYAENEKCNRCPIAEKSEQQLCKKTPFADYVAHADGEDWFILDGEDAKEGLRLANLELQYLKDLLKELKVRLRNDS
jgi:hypothetical protein